MRIAVDARELAGEPTGVGRMLGEILREWAVMPEAAAHEFVLCAPAAVAAGLHFSTASPTRITVEVEDGAGTMWEQRVLPRLAARVGADVLFCPGYSGPIFSTMPLVVAIHDVSFAAHPEWYRWREGVRRRLVTRAAARRAARVITISEFSRGEIAEHLGVPRSNIDVVYLGVTPVAQRFLPAEGPRAKASSAARTAAGPLILFVGSIFNRRHVPETIRGFARLARRYPDARLTIVGDNRTFPQMDLGSVIGDTSQDSRVRVESYVADAALAELYRDARAFVFLSSYEGFGLTPLEALAAGIPIVVLDTAVAREIYGPAAMYVAAADPRLIEAALEQALFDDEARTRVLSAAPAILARYSWRRCAKRILEIVESCHRNASIDRHR